MTVKLLICKNVRSVTTHCRNVYAFHDEALPFYILSYKHQLFSVFQYCAAVMFKTDIKPITTRFV